MSKAVEKFQTWIESFPQDIAAMQKVVDNEKVPLAARRYATAGLNYLLQRLDIIPDSQPATGILDDAFVLRVAALLASEHDVSAAGTEALTTCSRLSNDTDLIRDFFGDDIFKKLRLYTERLAEAEVRRRRPDSILSDDKVRKAFFAEVSDEVRHFLPAPQVKDADAIERELKSYFKAKLASI